jgi:hypothetical protein
LKQPGFNQLLCHKPLNDEQVFLLQMRVPGHKIQHALWETDEVI